MKTYTLEELEEKEVNILNMTKERNTANINKIQERVDIEKDLDELKRLKALLDLHKSHKKDLAKVKPKQIASKKFAEITAKRITDQEITPTPNS